MDSDVCLSLFGVVNVLRVFFGFLSSGVWEIVMIFILKLCLL